jgi:hypothetical protein
MNEKIIIVSLPPHAQQLYILCGEKMGQLFSTSAKILGSKVVSVVHITHFVVVVKQQQQQLYMECELL